MFDIGGWEFLVIALLAIIIIGPKDLPAAVRTVTTWARKARALASDFRSGLDDIAREVELDKVQDQIRDGLGGDDLTASVNSIRDEIEHSIDPTDGSEDTFEHSDEFAGMPVGDEDEDDDTVADAFEDADRRNADAEADVTPASDPDEVPAADSDKAPVVGPDEASAVGPDEASAVGPDEAPAVAGAGGRSDS